MGIVKKYEAIPETVEAVRFSRKAAKKIAEWIAEISEDFSWGYELQEIDGNFIIVPSDSRCDCEKEVNEGDFIVYRHETDQQLYVLDGYEFFYDYRER